MGRRKRKQSIDAFYLNEMTLNFYRMWLKDIVLSLFKYKNIPNNVNIRYMENLFFNNGYACFFEETENTYLCLECQENSTFLDVYDEPTKYTVIANNGFRRNLTNENSVIIYNNFIRSNDAHVVELFATRLANVQRTIDVNLQQQKTPRICMSTESQKLTLLNYLEQYDGNEPFILTDKLIDIDSFNIFDNTAPYVADKLSVQQNIIFNQFLTYYGIENSNMDKKERMVSNEVFGNYGIIEMSRNSRLDSRQIGFEKANKMYGLNMEVEYNSDLISMLNMPNMFIDEGGDDNE